PRLPAPGGLLLRRSAARAPAASKRCLQKNRAIPTANATRTKALITALPITTSGWRALAERRAGKSTLSGSIAARGLRGMRLGSLLLRPAAGASVAVRQRFFGLAGIEDGDDDPPRIDANRRIAGRKVRRTGPQSRTVALSAVLRGVSSCHRSTSSPTTRMTDFVMTACKSTATFSRSGRIRPDSTTAEIALESQGSAEQMWRPASIELLRHFAEDQRGVGAAESE